MERVNRILANETFKENMLHLQRLEKDRQYCRHGIDHLLDVARLAYIEDLEKGLAIEKEIIYGTALLHDLGRVLEYIKQIPHNEASVQLAKEILPECGFNNEEVKRICGAIAAHRDEKGMLDDGLAGLLYRADKKSRTCFDCLATKTCKWSEEKKNHLIVD